MPRVSVCITHYNRPEKLAATLESLASQTRTPDEVFLWDDCSPKDPTEVARQFQHRFPHFVYHRNASNLGMPGNLNALLPQATGDYIANLHDADLYTPTLIEKWVDALERFPTAGLVFCQDSRWARNPEHMTPAQQLAPLSNGQDFFDRCFVGQWSSLIWGTVMVRKEVYQQLLPFDSRYKNWADVDMWMRICRDWDIAYVAEPLLELDWSDTPLRSFSWYRILLAHEMTFANIHRIYAHAPQKREACLRRQLACMRRRIWRHFLASFKWVSPKRFSTGLSVLPRIYRAGASAGDGTLLKGLSF